MEAKNNVDEASQRTIFTIGHSTRTLSEFTGLLREAQIGLLVDVRSIPRSRTNPQFNKDVLPVSLAAERINYIHLSALGGLRHKRNAEAPSGNRLWRNVSFRNYADYAETEAFRGGLDELEARAQEKRCAIMCAEAVWWRCHRRIIADYLITRGYPVAHIMGAGKIDPARVTPGAIVLPEGTLLYPPAEEFVAEFRRPR
jgi:uncharacterized protein (DUF488 family)